MIFYFAYGSNLHHLQMKRRCPNCRFIKKIILRNYSLTFRSKYGAADIEKKMGKKVYGALYIISKCAERRLDKYEDYPENLQYLKYQNPLRLILWQPRVPEHPSFPAEQFELRPPSPN